jgi:hypothetical protein
MNFRWATCCAALCAAGSLAAGRAGAAPVTYTAFAITDVSLNGHSYHNASVYLTFAGDTGDIQTFDVVAPDGNKASGWQIAQGNASLRITTTNGKTIHAKFLPNQIVVSYDFYNGGAGFGSFVGTDHHFEPAYPLAMDGSTVFDAPDIATSGAWSGHAWSCVGFPPAALGTGSCSDPTAYPLQTDHGPFVVFQPYLSFSPPGYIWDDFSGSLNNGIFSVLVGN